MSAEQKTLRVNADYDCWALWVFDPPRMDNIDPSTEEFGLSDALVRELNRWSADYTGILNREDPAETRFPSDAAEAEFIDRGRTLAKRVRAEVDRSWRVTYYDGELRTDVEIT